MSPRSHAAADAAVLSLITLLAAPSAIALFPPACLALRAVLGGYAPGPWSWMTLPFAISGAAALTAVAAPPPPAVLGLLWLSASLVLVLAQMATRTVSDVVAPLTGSSVMRRV